MKFMQLFGLIALLAPLSLAASAGTNDELEERAPLPAQAGDAAPAMPDKQQIDSTCNNPSKLDHVVGACNPRKSRGFRRAAHNCPGKHYYCFNTDTKKGKCMKIKFAKQKGYENGECFL